MYKLSHFEYLHKFTTFTENFPKHLQEGQLFPCRNETDTVFLQNISDYYNLLSINSSLYWGFTQGVHSKISAYLNFTIMLTSQLKKLKPGHWK